MTMRPVDGIDLPAGEAVALEPGGLHVMLLDLPAPLEIGQTYELTLTFEQAGEQTVTVEVREEAP
ncbi:MAG: copper chaperone PCu(A)C, partial [Acidimicrobiales bacterium]|nr:copper chaperone PCu(A)C [Acidimicrobiales bacterium]